MTLEDIAKHIIFGLEDRRRGLRQGKRYASQDGESGDIIKQYDDEIAEVNSIIEDIKSQRLKLIKQ